MCYYRLTKQILIKSNNSYVIVDYVIHGDMNFLNFSLKLFNGESEFITESEVLIIDLSQGNNNVKDI